VIFFTNINYRILNSFLFLYLHFTYIHTHINYSVFYLNLGISLIVVPRQLNLNYKNQTVLTVELNSNIHDHPCYHDNPDILSLVGDPLAG